MGKHKTTTTQSGTQSGSQNSAFNNQNTFDWKTAPDTEDTKAYRDWRPQIDPGLGYQYGNARNQLTSSFNDPMGGYSTPQVRDAQLRTGMRNLNQDEAQAFRGGYNDVNSQRGNQLGTLAAMNHPQLVQTGGSGTSNGTSTGTYSGNGQSVQSGGFLGDLLLASIGGPGAAAAGKNRHP
jgi:hypothetical protein